MNSISGVNANDAWHSARGGFRLDHSRGIDQFTLQGDIFYNSIGDTFDKTLLSPPIIQSTAARGHNEGVISDYAGIARFQKNHPSCFKLITIGLIINC